MSHAGIKHAAALKLTKYILYCMYLTHTNLREVCSANGDEDFHR